MTGNARELESSSGEVRVRRLLPRLLEMIRFSHTIFALPFALLAAVMAWTTPTPTRESVAFEWRQLGGILICMVGARSAAMAFNRLVDKRIDAENPRTAGRHLPSGQLSVMSVVLFTLIASAIFVAGTVLFLPNPWPLRLALPVLAFLFGYSYAKRWTAAAHWWLGIALMLAPICAWIALRGLIVSRHPADLVPSLLIGLAVMLWVSGFDIIYACQDASFDREAGLHSVPAQVGVAGALRIAAICHLLMVATLAALPTLAAIAGTPLSLGWIYYTAIAMVAVLLVYEHALVRPDDLTRVNIAFFQVNAIVSIGLLAAASLDLLT